jgi:hypothetical protein
MRATKINAAATIATKSNCAPESPRVVEVDAAAGR